MHAKQKLQQSRTQRQHTLLQMLYRSTADAVVPVITTVQFTNFIQTLLMANAASHHDALWTSAVC